MKLFNKYINFQWLCVILNTGHQTSQAFTEAHRGRWGRRQPTEFPPPHLVDLLVCVFNNTQPTPGFNFSAEAFKELLSQFTAETFPCGRERRRKGGDDDSYDSDDRDHSTFSPMASFSPGAPDGQGQDNNGNERPPQGGPRMGGRRGRSGRRF